LVPVLILAIDQRPLKTEPPPSLSGQQQETRSCLIDVKTRRSRVCNVASLTDHTCTQAFVKNSRSTQCGRGFNVMELVMSERKDTNDATPASVVCDGTLEAPHEPEHLFAETGSDMACPVCGKVYRRSARWSRRSGATWPKAE
jgi:hypothetical protein